MYLVFLTFLLQTILNSFFSFQVSVFVNVMISKCFYKLCNTNVLQLMDEKKLGNVKICFNKVYITNLLRGAPRKLFETMFN